MDAGVSVSIIEEALAEVVGFLKFAPISPRTRELRARAATYERVVSGWTFRPPSPAQCTAMLECVMEIHGTVLGPRRSLKPPAPWGGARPSGRPTLPPASTRSPSSWSGPPPPSSRSPLAISRPPPSRSHTRTTRPPPMPSRPPPSSP